MKAEPNKILIVDDKENILKAMSLKLKNVGYDCFTAARGETALEILAREKIDLVITDFRMPEMDGNTLNKIIHKNYSNLPVLMFTGDGNIEAANDFLGNNGKRYMEKPINFEFLNMYIAYEIKVSDLNKNLKDAEKKETEVLKILDTVKSLGYQTAQKIRNIHNAADEKPDQDVLYRIRSTAKEAGQNMAAITKTIGTLGA